MASRGILAISAIQNNLRGREYHFCDSENFTKFVEGTVNLETGVSIAKNVLW